VDRFQRSGILPSHVQQLETVQLLRPLAVVQQQQQQLKQPRSWRMLLQQLASQRAAAVFYVLLAIGLVWFVAGGRARPQPAAAAGQVTATDPSLDSSRSNSPELQLTTVAAEAQHTAAELGSKAEASTSGLETPQDSAGSSSSSTSPGSSSSSSSSAELHVRCHYGSLPGTWVSGAPTGSKWQVLDAECQLNNWLAAYAAAAAAAEGASTESSAHVQSSDTASLAAGSTDADVDASAAPAVGSSSGSSSSSSIDVLPVVNILLLSDSVDRFILEHVCEYLHGTKQTIRAQPHHMQQPAAPGPAAPNPQTQSTDSNTDTGSSSSASSSSPAAANGSVGSSASSPEPAGASSGPSNLNATAYAFHACQLPEGVPLKLASSYFPGVHPTGPFHRDLTQNYAARIDAAAAMWEEYAGAGQPPHVVGVASALWDVARLWMHERQQLEGPELGKPLLQGWMANFSTVVQYSRQQLPQVRGAF